MFTKNVTMDFHYDYELSIWSHLISVLVFAAMDTQILIISAEFKMNWQPKELYELHLRLIWTTSTPFEQGYVKTSYVCKCM